MMNMCNGVMVRNKGIQLRWSVKQVPERSKLRACDHDKTVNVPTLHPEAVIKSVVVAMFNNVHRTESGVNRVAGSRGFDWHFR